MWAIFVFDKQAHLSCVWVTLFMGAKMLPSHLARSNLPDSRGRIFVDKIRNTKLYVKTYFHFQLLLDPCA